MLKNPSISLCQCLTKATKARECISTSAEIATTNTTLNGEQVKENGIEHNNENAFMHVSLKCQKKSDKNITPKKPRKNEYPMLWLRMKYSKLMADTSVPVVEKRYLNSLPSIMSTMMEQHTEKKCLSVKNALTQVVAVLTPINGLRKMVIPKDSRSYVGIANGVSRKTMVSVPIRKGLTTIPKGSTAKRLEARNAQEGDEIVCSAWKHAAVTPSDGLRLANSVEHKGLHNKLTFIGSIDRQHDNRFAVSGAKIGTTLQVRLPNQYSVRTGNVMQVNDTVENSVALTVATQKGVDMNFSSSELTLSLDDFSERIIQPAMSTLASNVENDALSMMLQVYNCVGTSGSATTTLLPWLQARAKLNQMLAPKDNNRHCLVDSNTMAQMVEGLKTLFHQDSAISKQYREGFISRNAGMQWWENELTQTLTHGTITNSTPVTGTWSSANPNQIPITGGLSAGTIAVGQIFTMAGVYAVNPETKQQYSWLQQFVVTQALTLSGGAGTITFSPSVIPAGSGILPNPLQNVSNSPAASQAVVFLGSASTAYTYDMVYHKDAFAFVTADLELPKGVDFAAREVMDGISMRIVRAFDITNDKMPCRIDVLYGYVAQRPQTACRVIGSNQATVS